MMVATYGVIIPIFVVALLNLLATTTTTTYIDIAPDFQGEMNLQVGGRSRIWSSTASLASRRCSKGDGRGSEGKGNGGPPVDWDKAWSNFGKRTRSKKKRMISNFDPDKYVSWNPKRSEYPLSEEIDPIKKAERSNLMLWTSPGFTLVGAILLLSLLLVYTILFPLK